MPSTIGTKSVFSIQFLDKDWQTDKTKNNYITYCQVDSIDQADGIVDMMRSQDTPYYWIWRMENDDSKFNVTNKVMLIMLKLWRAKQS